MKARDISKLSYEVTKQLMTNAIGEKAKRLAMISEDKRDLGGWCETAVMELIAKALFKACSDKPKP